MQCAWRGVISSYLWVYIYIAFADRNNSLLRLYSAKEEPKKNWWIEVRTLALFASRFPIMSLQVAIALRGSRLVSLPIRLLEVLCHYMELLRNMSCGDPSWKRRSRNVTIALSTEPHGVFVPLRTCFPTTRETRTNSSSSKIS